MGQIKLDAMTCDFCEKHQFQVRKLIAGPKACICNECIDLCLGIIRDEDAQNAARTTDDSKEAGQ